MKRIYVVIFICLFTACNQPEKEKILNYGNIENSTYTNDYFDIKLTLPEKWAVQNREQTESMMEQGTEKIRTTNEGMAEQLDLSKEQIVHLLTMFQHEVGSTTDFNISFILMAEKLPVAANFLSGKQYLDQAGEMLKQSGQYGSVGEDKVKINVGGKDFYKLHAVINQPTVEVQQDFIATIMNGYALCFIITYTNEAQEQQLKKILDTVTFDS